MLIVKRSIHNPILIPQRHIPWEAAATFNWSPVAFGKKTICLYRAMSEITYHEGAYMHLSTIGMAESSDSIHYTKRRQFIVPEEEWERFGCEDPRICKVGDKYYIFYTALGGYPFNSGNIKVGVAITKDFKKVESKHLVTPFNAKAFVLFPEKVGGKYVAHRCFHTDEPPSKMAIAFFDKIEDVWSPDYWRKWEKSPTKHHISPNRKDRDQIEIGAPPIKTPLGWLLVYSHIQDYGTDKPIFGTEAILLDLDDPRRIKGSTRGPLFTPEETYEYFGQVPKICFPSGAIVIGKNLRIYYGASDTTGCFADLNLKELLAVMGPLGGERLTVRFPGNPILVPRGNTWESKAVFNPAAIDLDGSVHILYRAQSNDNTSVIGYARSKNGLTIDERLDEPIYVPRTPHEEKRVQGGNSGCEDPRVTKIGNRIYMCYTAYNGVEAPAATVTSILEKDFLARKWNWSDPVFLSPDNVDDKDACIFPSKVNGQYLALHRIGGVVSADWLPDLRFEGERLSNRMQILAPRPGMWDGVKVGIAAPPIKTDHGWLLFYHGVSNSSTYRTGIALLDKDDPTVVIARSVVPILEPKEKYEKEGQIPKVVFPCGVVVRKGQVLLYYGGGDSVVAGAMLPLKDLLGSLR